MQKISPGVFQVLDGETVSIDGTATGTQWLVTANAFGAAVPGAKPINITLDKSKAQGGSFVPNAKSTDVVLGFTFDGNSGGRYDLTLTGGAGGSFSDFVEQAGSTMEATTYTFHIV